MSYQVLARKWRPQNFKQMVGQEHVLKALIHALESQRLHHAYLFTGTRGVGKTTIGRILAKCLSCHKGITAEPCGECGACRSISEGRYVDLIEIDAASRTKVEDMRELLDNVQYAPSEGRFKIYLIDEVHMLSQSSFNALLKTLEEPPAHVKFLFATTDPQKLPVTILSRCLQFNLKNMSPERIVQHLQNILTQEQVGFEEMALWALARAADGSMRDALSLTDQAIAYGNSMLTEQGVSTMLGTVDQKKIYRILDSLLARDAAEMLRQVHALSEFAPNYASVLSDISEILHRVAIEQAVPGAVDNSMGDQSQVQHYATSLCAEDVQLFYQIALVSRQDLAITPDPKTGLEMALLRMLAFALSPNQQDQSALQNSSPNDSPLEAMSQVEVASSQGEGSWGEDGQGGDSQAESSVRAEDYAAENIPADTSLVVESVSVEQVHETPSAEFLSSDAMSSDKFSEASSTQEIEDKKKVECAKPEVEMPIDGPPALQDAQVAGDHGRVDDVVSSGWNKEVGLLGLSGMTLNLLLNAVLERESDRVLVFFESGHFRLLNTSHEKRIKDSIAGYYKGSQDIQLLDGLKPEHETPMMWRERMKAEMAEQARQSMKSDPNVLKMIQDFDGVLLEGSIESLGQIV